MENFPNDLEPAHRAFDKSPQARKIPAIQVLKPGALNDPLDLALAPKGDLVAANGADGGLVEVCPEGREGAVKTAESTFGAGNLFGLAIAPLGQRVYIVEDGENTLKLFTTAQGQRP